MLNKTKQIDYIQNMGLVCKRFVQQKISWKTEAGQGCSKGKKFKSSVRLILPTATRKNVKSNKVVPLKMSEKQSCVKTEIIN